jgi:hypothetical protein
MHCERNKGGALRGLMPGTHNGCGDDSGKPWTAIPEQKPV